MPVTETFGGRSYRKLSGARYDYWISRVPKDEKGLLISLESFSRLMALCLAADDGSWAVTLTKDAGECPLVEAKVSEIVDEWPVEELLEVGSGQLIAFNNLGIKAQDDVEKN